MAVPCCVFPSLFPDRCFADGSPVISRSDFVRYLCETYALERESIGAFAGANVACFTSPPDASLAAAGSGGGGVAAAGAAAAAPVPPQGAAQ